MKFCKYCGTQLEDNEVCKCDDIQREKAFVEAVAVDKTEETVNRVSSELSNTMKAYQNFYISSWKNPTGTIRTETSNNISILAVFNIAMYFVSVLLFNCAFLSRIPKLVGELLGDIDSWIEISSKMFEFSKVLSTAVIMSLLIGGGNLLCSYVLLKSNNSGTTLKNSVTAFSVFSLPAATLFIIAALFTLMHPMVGLTCAAVAVVYLMIANYNFVLSKIKGIDSTKTICIVTALVSVFVIILIYAFIKTFVWNVIPTELFN